MQRILAVLITFVLGFAEISALAHQLEATGSCHESEQHLCPEENHHHCELCEDYVVPLLLEQGIILNAPASFCIDRSEASLKGIFTEPTLVFSGRAPPSE